MYTLQLGDNLFVELDVGDLFIYRYSSTHSGIIGVSKTVHPPLNEYCVEIMSFHSRRHFLLRRDNGYY